MKTNYLLPYRFKKIGWLILIPITIVGILMFINGWQPEIFKTTVFGIYLGYDTGRIAIGLTENNVLDEIICILMIVGAIMVAFSKEKYEDELVSSIRLRSLVWATYANYAIILLALLFGFSMYFAWFMGLNMFTVLILFILKFNWSLAKLRKSIVYEE